MRHAKIVLIIYLVATLLLLVSFVLDVYYLSPGFMEMEYYQGTDRFMEESYPYDAWIRAQALVIGLIIIIVVIYSLFFLGYAIFKRSFTTARIYLLIILTSFMGPLLELPIKGHIYAWFPQLCQHPLRQGQRATVCYERLFTTDPAAGDTYNIIVYNPDDEMSLPGHQWSSELNKEVGEQDGAKKLARHIYLIDSLP